MSYQMIFIAISIILVVIGALLYKENKKRLAIVFFIVGPSVFLLNIIVGKVSSFGNKADKIKMIDAEHVDRIILSRTEVATYAEISLFENKVIITSENEIANLCDALRTSKKIILGSDRAEYTWACRMEIIGDNESTIAGIRGYEKMAKITLHSDGEYGVPMGKLSCPALIPVLREYSDKLPGNTSNGAD